MKRNYPIKKDCFGCDYKEECDYTLCVVNIANEIIGQIELGKKLDIDGIFKEVN